jgi:hypothetical protein
MNAPGRRKLLISHQKGQAVQRASAACDFYLHRISKLRFSSQKYAEPVRQLMLLAAPSLRLRFEGALLLLRTSETGIIPAMGRA